MKGKKKTKLQLSEIIDSLQKQIIGLLKLKPKLEKKKEELRELEETLENRVDTRTSAERVVEKLLHAEIEQRKRSEQAMQDTFEYINAIINTIRDPLVVLDTDLKVISASRSFYQTFTVKPEDTEKQHIYDLGDHQWNIPKLRELLEDILCHDTHFNDFEVEHDFPGIGKRMMLLNARKIYRKAKQAQFILLAIEDVTKHKEAEEKLKILASHDGLTGCVNFRSMMQILESEIARSKRYQKEFSVIMIDIDQLKRINDEYGHMTGNDALVAFANVVKNSVRSIDIVGRYGGDEFVVVLPETDPQDALVVLERIRNDLNQATIISPHVQNRELTLQFSAGIADFPHNAKDLKELIWVVDGALRQAKQKGKNRAVVEKRRFIRVNPLSGTRIEIVDSLRKQNGKILKIANISKEGMLLLSTQDILDEELLCRIYSPKDEFPFEFICKVKHKGKSESQLYRIGVYFPEVAESLKKKLSNCMESPKEID